MKLPLEILREKYIPVSSFPSLYNISVPLVMSLIENREIRPAEFRAPGESRRSLHANYEEVLEVLRKKEIEHGTTIVS